jgi:hypothetical protein
MTQNRKEEKTIQFKRNELGLFDNVEYKYLSDGYIDWRAMVNNKFLIPNDMYFKNHGLPTPPSIDGLSDEQLYIRLPGVRELARLRGIEKIERPVSYQLPDGGAVASCKITFLPNFETNFQPLVYEEIASATRSNCNYIDFAETIACNRAFVRAVKNALNIYILSDEEIKKEPISNTIDQTSPLVCLKEIISNVPLKDGKTLKISTIEELKNFLPHTRAYKNRVEEVNSWQSFEQIPTEEVKVLIGLFKGV